MHNFDLVFSFEFDLSVWALGVAFVFGPIGVAVTVGPFLFAVELA